MRKKIRLPVLRSLSVRHYPMYPGPSDGSGFEQPLPAGVCVIVGMNGIGKTTLLNLLHRMLTGPFDPRKADLGRPGAGRHAMTELRRFNYFSSRVESPIPAAIATVEVAFGEKDVVRVTRALADLRIVELWHNQRRLVDADHVRFQELVCELSGLDTHWDFDFVVRHLVFFLEEKAPLLWSEEGQFELLRALFLDSTDSKRCVELTDAIFKLDSQIRNKNWRLNELRDKLAEIEEATATGDEVTQESIPVLETRLNAVNETLQTLAERETREGNELDGLEKQAFEAEIRLDEARSELRRSEQGFFRALLPDIPAATELVLGHLIAGEACLVCGSDTSRAQERLRRLEKLCACPVCETPDVAKSTGNATSISASRLQRLESKAAAAAAEHARITDLLQHGRRSFEQLKQDQRNAWREQAQLQSCLSDLRAQIPPSSDEARRLRGQVTAEEKELKALRVQVLKQRKGLAQVLQRASQSISQVADKICADFSHFASQFLEEDCRLDYTMAKRMIGQAGTSMEFPAFSVQMSSALTKTPSTRGSADQVSESQKEFLDLAFRMAVMRTAASRKSPAMLVIETPEASLDSFFVARAGQMLREFTYVNKECRHTVIASSNLNRENMIPELLGLRGGSRPARANEDVASRVINLLEISAKPRALTAHLHHYEKNLKEALSAE